MKYSVGYQITDVRSYDGKTYMEYIVQNKEHISELYFSWGDIANGRCSMLQNDELLPWEAQQRQIRDLEYISKSGIALNLLLNANCYGVESQSRSFFNKIGYTINYISENFGLSSVTTTSPLIAKFIHSNFDGIDVRASVNMKIGTTIAMEYVSEYFDSFYMQRDFNRSAAKIKELSKWCADNGKGLYILANSGCLNYCSAHTFHDNLVAHEAEISKMDNAYDFRGICREFLTKPENRVSVIRDTNFIRPEDIHLYDEYFTSAKLATRVSANPIKILRAYIDKSFTGAVTDLLEPNHTDIFYPCIIENKKIPEDFARHTMNCDKNCSVCGYCASVASSAAVELDKEI